MVLSKMIVTDDSNISDTYNNFFCNMVELLNIEENQNMICHSSDEKDRY